MNNREHEFSLVLQCQRLAAERLASVQAKQANELDVAINSSEELLRSLEAEPPERAPHKIRRPMPTLRPWEVILGESELLVDSKNAQRLQDVLSTEQVAAVAGKHRQLELEFKGLHQLDKYDWMTAGVAGGLAALVDIFLVQIPKQPGFLGRAEVEGGWLSNAVKTRFGKILPDDKIAALEREYPVSFDPATNHGLERKVSGLGPRTHRFQSLGHDPLLGWLFGVRDLLQGTFTAIGTDGVLVSQATGDPFREGEAFFVRLFEALRVVFGHMKSDVATAQGLPVPLMPLLLFIQTGKIGKKGYSIAQVARQMYAMKFDFRHFCSQGLPVMLIEGITRIASIARRLHEGSSLREAIPSTNHPKLRTQLFTAHLVSSAANAGKVYFAQNILGVSAAQWMALFRYAVPQAHWLLLGKEKARSEFLAEHIDESWRTLDAKFSCDWGSQFKGDQIRL